MYETIDSIPHASLDWKTFKFQYTGALPAAPKKPPKWMKATYELNTLDMREVIHEQFRSPDLQNGMRLLPVREFEADGTRCISDLMTGDWVWKKAVSSRRQA
jgi:hypothetical protein